MGNSCNIIYNLCIKWRTQKENLRACLMVFLFFLACLAAVGKINFIFSFWKNKNLNKNFITNFFNIGWKENSYINLVTLQYFKIIHVDGFINYKLLHSVKGAWSNDLNFHPLRIIFKIRLFFRNFQNGDSWFCYLLLQLMVANM